jgi:hypothetical protein
MSIERKIKRASKRAEALQKRAKKKKLKGKDEKAKKLEAKAASKRGKAAGLYAAKAAPSLMMGPTFKRSGMLSESDTGDKKLKKNK